MATGDIKNNLRILKKELKLIQYNQDVEIENMVIGITNAFLPILHYLVVDYSCELSLYLSSNQYDFFGKTDLRFIEVLYKVLMKEFSMKPMLTKQQFFSVGFPEIKIIFLTKIINAFRLKNEAILMKLDKHKTKPVSHCASNNTSSKKNVSKLQQSVSIVKTDHPLQTNSVVSDKQSVSNNSHTKPILNSSVNLPELSFKINNIVEKVDNIQNKEVEITQRLDQLMSNINKNNHQLSNIDPLDVTLLDDSFDQVSTQSITLDAPFHNETSYHNDKFNQSETTIVDDLSFNNENFLSSNIRIEKHFPSFATNNGIDFHITDASKDGNINANPIIHNRSVDTNQLTIDSSDIKKELKVDLSCDQCYENKTQMNEMQSCIKTLQEQLKTVLSVNNEMSAKMLLLETRIDLLENKSDHSKPKQIKNYLENTCDKGNQDQEFFIYNDQAKQTRNYDKSNQQGPSSQIDEESSRITFMQDNGNCRTSNRKSEQVNIKFKERDLSPSKEYSSFNYTDSEEINGAINNAAKQKFIFVDSNKENDLTDESSAFYNSNNFSFSAMSDTTKNTFINVQKQIEETKKLFGTKKTISKF